MGRRSFKKVTVNGTVTLHQRYLYRGYLQIACIDLTRSHHPGLWLITWDPTQPIVTRPLAIQKDGTWYTYGWDLTKNICELYSTGGHINTAYSYSPYGKVTASGSLTQPIQWSSEHFDSELDLYCYNFRYYNNSNGIWNIPDLLLPLNVYSTYSFVQNTPISTYDILGLMTIEQWVRYTYAPLGLSRNTLIALLIVASRGCIGVVGTKLGVDASAIDLTRCYRKKAEAESALKELNCSKCRNILGQKSKPRLFSVHTYEGKVYNQENPYGFERKFESTDGVYNISDVRDNPASKGNGFGNYDFAILEKDQMIGATHADLKLYNAVIRHFKLKHPLMSMEDVLFSIQQNPQMYIRDVDSWQSEINETTGYNAEFWCIMCERDDIRN